MSKTIYLVKKNPGDHCDYPEWLQMDGRQFHTFIHSAEGKGRYFIHLMDDISFEPDEIYIEASREEYQAWKLEHNRHRYLVDCADGKQTLSIDAPVGSGEESLIDTLVDPGVPVDEVLSMGDERERLHKAMMMLAPEEQRLIHMLYFCQAPMTQRQVAAALHVSLSVDNKRIRRVLKKLQALMET